MTTNFGAAAADYARFRAGFPDSFFSRLAEFGIGGSDETVIDVGTGTGTLARGFALRGCHVIGIDPDQRLLAQARQLDEIAGVTVRYETGRAEAIPLANEAADVVSAGQCWHWFDGPAAAREMARVTKLQGRVVVAHFDWLPLPGNVVETTEQLILKHNPQWHLSGGNGFHPESLPHLHAAGYRDFEMFAYDVEVPYTPVAWRGRIRASAGIGASLTPENVQVFDAELAKILEESFPADEIRAPHRVFCIIGRLSSAS